MFSVSTLGLSLANTNPLGVVPGDTEDSIFFAALATGVLTTGVACSLFTSTVCVCSTCTGTATGVACSSFKGVGARLMSIVLGLCETVLASPNPFFQKHAQPPPLRQICNHV